MNDPPAPDTDVEANWYDEFAGALESVAAEYRRAARLLRFAGAALRSGELDPLRAELAIITARVVAAANVGAQLHSIGKGGVK